MTQTSDRNGKSKWQDNNQLAKGIISAKFIPDTGFDKRIVKAEWELDAAPLKTVENDPAKYNTEILWSQQDTGTFTVVITTEINDSEPVYAKIDFIETQLNQSENSLRVRVYLNNSKLKLPVGLRLQGTVRANPVKALWLPKQAMVSIGTKKMVFVKLENGFKAREINTGITINNYIQILKGITKNDTVAANAQYLIDSESFIKTR